jgi:hypothetical protein
VDGMDDDTVLCEPLSEHTELGIVIHNQQRSSPARSLIASSFDGNCALLHGAVVRFPEGHRLFDWSRNYGR